MWRRDERGVVAVLAALFLPIVLFLFALLVDLGTALVKRERLRATVELSAQAGASVVSDLIVERAEAHNPPPDATDPLLYLTDDDRIAIANDTRVRDAVQNFIDGNRIGQTGTPTVTMIYPDNTVDCSGSRDQKRIDLRLTMTDTSSTLFPNLFVGETARTVRATALQSVPMCPS